MISVTLIHEYQMKNDETDTVVKCSVLKETLNQNIVQCTKLGNATNLLSMFPYFLIVAKQSIPKINKALEGMETITVSIASGCVYLICHINCEW